MRVVVGLGNPGSAYIETRHNVGFAVVEELAARWGVRLSRTCESLRVAEAVCAGEPVVLAAPQLFMNRSGGALAALTGTWQVTDLIVIHDELDLDPGTVRVKRGGGTAGHRGLASIVEHWGPAFARVRIGVGRPPADTDVADFVLAPFDAADRPVLDVAVRRAADAVESVLHEGCEAAMNRFNVRKTNGATKREPPVGRN
jgi:peptidyl-tRNA hydrolase, PTH1 family